MRERRSGWRQGTSSHTWHAAGSGWSLEKRIERLKSCERQLSWLRAAPTLTLRFPKLCLRRDGTARLGTSERSSSADKAWERDRKSTRLNSSHGYISYAVFCLKKKKTHISSDNSIST